jgi:hypothetical protein
MKTVFSNSEVAHIWASQTQNEGRSSNGSYFFRNNTIYSYGHHFPIATIKDNVCYFTTRSYSNSTAKHINYAAGASSHISKIFCYSPTSAAEGSHKLNLEDFNNRSKDISHSLANARKPAIYLNQIAHERSLFEKYCNHFGIKITKKLQALYPYVFIESLEAGKEATAAERKAMELERKRQKKEAALRLQKEIQDFRNFERSNLYTRQGFDLLRYNAEKSRIETSQSVQIPLQVAKGLYLEFKNVSNGAKCTLCGSLFMERYNISQISKEGIVIGCHNIKADEINLLAASLNW